MSQELFASFTLKCCSYNKCIFEDKKNDNEEQSLENDNFPPMLLLQGI